MKKFLIILALLIFLSGCTQNSGNTIFSNNGITINDFSVEPNNVIESDDTVRFYLDLENVGSTTATCVKAELFGIENWAQASGMPVGGMSILPFGLSFNYYDNNNFEICESGVVGGLLNWAGLTTTMANENFCYSENNNGRSMNLYISGMWGTFTDVFCNSFSDVGFISNYPGVRVWSSLSPPLPERNRQGQFVTTEWILRPPQLPEGTQSTFPVTARVSYMYTTTATATVRAFNNEEYERRIDLGQPVNFPVDISNGNEELVGGAPIQVAVTKETSPIIVNQKRPGYELAPYKFEFKNVGDGWPLPYESDLYNNGGFIFSTIEVRGPGAYFYDCAGKTFSPGTTSIYLDSELANLRSDRTAPFGCTIGIDRVAWIDRPLDTIQFVFNLYYIYYVDEELDVTVLGVDRF